jgi:hypothetical protein
MTPMTPDEHAGLLAVGLMLFVVGFGLNIDWRAGFGSRFFGMWMMALSLLPFMLALTR